MKLSSPSTAEDGVGLDPTLADSLDRDQHNDTGGVPLEHTEKGRWERIWPTLACGAGLFSDGYLNSFVLSTFVLSA